MATYLITGASRGIGLELTKQLIQLPASQVGKVFTVSRSEAPPALQELLTNNPDRVVHILASINDTASVQKAAQDVKAKLDGSGLDVLVNNAGIQQFAGSAKDMKPEEMAHEFDINCVGPHRMIRAFLPLLEAGKQKKVINISSALASITWTARFSFAPTPSYKISKAALHMLISQYANQYSESGFTFLCVSPGWLKTNLGGEEADLEVEDGVAEVKRIILEAGPSQNGKFLNIHVPGQEQGVGHYDGGEIPW